MAAQWRSVEVKSYAEETRYYLFISGHIDSILKLDIPLRSDFKDIIRKARDAYMPTQVYDEMGSNIRVFANNYIRIMHVSKRTSSEEVAVFSREQVSDILLNDGWSMIGFSSFPGPTITGMVVVERWSKKE